jgi:hypothetical protein
MRIHPLWWWIQDWRPEEEVEAVKALETELQKGGSGDFKVTEVTLGLTDRDNKLVDSIELENFYNDEVCIHPLCSSIHPLCSSITPL